MTRLREVAVALAVAAACAPDAPRLPSGPTRVAASPTHAPLRLAVVGDMGTGGRAQRALAQRMCRWRLRRPFEVVLTTGDNVYPDGARARFDDAFFEPYDCLLSAGVRFHASLGNHDVLTNDGRPELREPAFGMDGRNYVLRLADARIVVADSNNLDRAWLRDALVSQPGDRWKIVVFHHPVYSSGTGHGSTPGFRPGLPRLFARRKVELVLNGHDHVFFVSKRLRGVRYVVTGGGGAQLYGCSTLWFTARCVARHHFLELAVSTDRLVVRAIPPRGPVFHTLVVAQKR